MNAPDEMNARERESFAAAQAVAAELIQTLTVLPREVSARQELGLDDEAACSVRIFCAAGDRRPVDELAARLGQPAQRELTWSGSSVYYEVHGQIDGITVQACTLLHPDVDDAVLRLGTGPVDTTAAVDAVVVAGADA
ncbi:hypothetical protein [Streptomyces aureocirculatus]|uniref:hypothetical protein n=1 Tax=Streptomyces aureocirculatus TaxID=67275 RepID=UPI0004CC3EC8|nr:hypothetical protein [Streptomyces aureocirculatus]